MGRSLGRIVGMFGAGGNDIIVLKTPEGEELLLPAMKEVVLRREEGHWVFRPPEYLDDDGEGDSDAL